MLNRPIPYSFTVTSHIIITAALALLVFFTAIVYGFWKNGLRFLKIFVPTGVPMYILPVIVAIEVLSFLTRPVSHSVRLFAGDTITSDHNVNLVKVGINYRFNWGGPVVASY